MKHSLHFLYIFLLFQKYRHATNHKHLDATIEFLEKTAAIIGFFKGSARIASVYDERLLSLQQVLDWFQKWHSTVPKQKLQKQFLSHQTYFDLQSALIGFKQIVYIITTRFPHAQLQPSTYNTDVVENIFCQQRSLNGTNDNPTCLQYRHGLNSILLGHATTARGNAGNVEPFAFQRAGSLRETRTNS